MSEESRPSAAYLPWATFKNALGQLAQGIPNRIDRSVFPGIAWNLQTQLFAGMRFLGLLKGEDQPTPELSELVRGSEEDRKAKLKLLLEHCYSELIAIDLTKATRAHLAEKLGELYGVTGDTRVKAVRFFITGAIDVGIPLSSFILPTKNGVPGGTKRRGTSRPRSATAKRVPEPTTNSGKGAEAVKPNGTSRSVTLNSGGTLTLSATLDLFSLNAADRNFVFGLIDQLEKYGGSGQ